MFIINLSFGCHDSFYWQSEQRITINKNLKNNDIHLPVAA
jgi:hypothetical protein